MNDPYRTTAADVKPSVPLRPYRVITVFWNENEDWKDQLELKLMEMHQSGYEVVSMADDGESAITVIMKLRNWT